MELLIFTRLQFSDEPSQKVEPRVKLNPPKKGESLVSSLKKNACSVTYTLSLNTVVYVYDILIQVLMMDLPI